jgi:hypothetical protein
MRVIVTETEQKIEQLRVMVGGQKVTLHHVPNWLRLKCLKVFGTPEFGDVDGYSVIRHALDSTGPSNGWLDHWGTIRISRKSVDNTVVNKTNFVSEPYGITAHELRHITSFSDKIKVRVFIEGNSWWYPGSTIQIIFLEP